MTMALRWRPDVLLCSQRMISFSRDELMMVEHKTKIDLR